MMWYTLGLGAVVFLVTASEEALSVKKWHAIQARSARRTAMYCGLLAGAMLLSMLSVVSQAWLAVAYISGAACGGWWAVARQHPKEERS